MGLLRMSGLQGLEGQQPNPACFAPTMHLHACCDDVAHGCAHIIQVTHSISCINALGLMSQLVVSTEQYSYTGVGVEGAEGLLGGWASWLGGTGGTEE